MMLVFQSLMLAVGNIASTCPWNMCSSHCSRTFVENEGLSMIWIPKSDKDSPQKESCRLMIMKIDGNILKTHVGSGSVFNLIF